MISVILIAALLVENIKSAIMCHSDCAPGMCHGDSMYTCTQCRPNMVMVSSLCKCKPGWFDLGGRCNYNLPNCVEAVSDGLGGLQCTKCETSRDTLVSGQCTRSLAPFFIRVGDTFTGSANNKGDIDFFFSSSCKTMASTRVCADCHPNSFLNSTTGKCDGVALCAVIDPANSSKCLTTVDGVYSIISPLQGLACSLGCKKCAGQAEKECLSCYDGYYFTRKEPTLTVGTCKPCFNTSCAGCSGPNPNDCFKAKRGYYLDSRPGTTEVKSCPAGCDMCESATNCSLCLNKISLNGVCLSEGSMISNCRYQYNTSSTSGKCLKYKGAFLTATNGQPYATNLALSSPLGYCVTEGQNEWSDRLSSVCLACTGDRILLNDFCRTFVDSQNILFKCKPTEYLMASPFIPLCIRCLENYINLPDGSCGTAADCISSKFGGLPVSLFVDSQGTQRCLTCASSCLQCQQVGADLACTQCAEGKTLFNGKCMSSTCGDGLLSENKQCDPNQSFSPEYPCTPDCLYTSADCPNSQNCYRQLFQLSASTTEENVVFLEIVQKYNEFYTYDFKSGVSIWTVNSNTQQILCNLVLPELDDPLTRCYSMSPVVGVNDTTTNRVVRIETTSNMMAKLKLKTSVQINNGTMAISRKFLTGLTADQMVSKTSSYVPVLFAENAKIAPVIAVSSPSTASVAVDYTLSYTILQAGPQITSFQWTVVSCLVNGVADSQSLNLISASLVQNTSTIPKTLILDQMALGVHVKVSYAGGTTQEASGTVLFSSNPQFFQLLDSSTLVVNSKAPVTILLSYSANQLQESDIEITSGGNQLVKGEGFSVKLFPETKRVLVTLKAIEGDYLINKAGALSTPVSLRLILTRFAEQVSIVVPSLVGKNQDITFWTNVGSDFQFQVFAFSQTSSQNYFSTSPAQSNYINTLTEKLVEATGGEQVTLFFKFFTPTYQAFYQRVLTVTDLDATLIQDLVPGTCYRDGSNLQSSKDAITLGIFKFQPDSATVPPTASHAIGSYSAGQLLSTTSDLSIAKVNFGLRMSPSIESLTAASATSTSFSISFTTTGATGMSCLLKLFNEPEVSVTFNHLASVSASSGVFEVMVLSSQGVNIWNQYHPSQFSNSIKVFPGLADTQPQLYWPIVLPDSGRYNYLALDAAIWTYAGLPNMSQPIVAASVYDFNKVVQSPKQTLIKSASWTPAQLPVSTYITTLNNSLTAATGQDLLRQLNLAAYTSNQAFLSCKLGGSCLADDKPIREMREMLWLQFNTFWNSVTDKEAWQDWTTSVLKSSFLGAITLTGDGFTDTSISQIEAEMIRDVTAMTDSITSLTAGLPRTHYKIGENLKAVLKVNLQNVELLINTYSHLLRLYGVYFKSLTNITQYQAKMNDVYLKTVILNEAKLLRYTMPSDTTVFENELVLLGGATLLSPLDPTYSFNFGEALAVELKNLQFNQSKVSPCYSRNPMRCL
jgi:hypothetical protein